MRTSPAPVGTPATVRATPAVSVDAPSTPVADTTASDPTPGVLPITGFNLEGMAGIAIGFLLAGGGALLAARAVGKRKARR